jgi:hypothetical protein
MKCSRGPHTLTTSAYRTKKHPRNIVRITTFYNMATNGTQQRRIQEKTPNTSFLNYFNKTPTWRKYNNIYNTHTHIYIIYVYIFLPSSSSVVLTRLSGPLSRPTASQKIWKRRESNPLYYRLEKLAL